MNAWKASRGESVLTEILFTAMLIFLMEIGDKTGLLVIALSSRSNKQGAIFLGALTALSAMALLGASLGYLLNEFVTNKFLLNIIVGLIFIGTGIIILLKSEDDDILMNEESASAPPSHMTWFLRAFVLVSAAEFLDKTQLTVVALIPFNGFFSTILGAILGFALITFLEILVGDRIHKFLPEKWINYLTVAIFIVTGLIIILLDIFA